MKQEDLNITEDTGLYIPKGTEIVYKGELIAKTKKRFDADYVPQPEDFEPRLDNGTVIQANAHFVYKGVLIYLNPYFLVSKEEIDSLVKNTE